MSHVLRTRIIAIAAIFFPLASALADGPVCAIDPGEMPARWLPRASSAHQLGDKPWSSDEAQDAAFAVSRALDELTTLFSKRPESVSALGTDAAEALIDFVYAGSNTPRIQNAARDATRTVVRTLSARFLDGGNTSASCKDVSDVLALTSYSHTVADRENERRLTAIGNRALRACGSVRGAIGYDLRPRLARGDLSSDELFSLVIWSIQFTDAQLTKGIRLPPGARDLPKLVWRYIETHPLAGALDYADGAKNPAFYDAAYLATHEAYVVTGYGRHAITVADAPVLYRFLRENFYPVLDMGELDLVAEFVDLFRQYGCTETNDRQVRDGTRYLLSLFHAAGDSWMAYREPNEPAEVADYDLIHKPWTGMAGVRERRPEPVGAGTYGQVVRRWLDARSASP